MASYKSWLKHRGKMVKRKKKSCHLSLAGVESATGWTRSHRADREHWRNSEFREVGSKTQQNLSRLWGSCADSREEWTSHLRDN